MRVLVTVSDRVWGGKHSYLFQVLEAWRDSKHEVIVCAEDTGEFNARLSTAGFTCVSVKDFVADNTATVVQLVRTIREYHVDLLLSTGRYDSLLLYQAAKEPSILNIPRLIYRGSAFPITFDAIQEEVYATATCILLCTRLQIEQQFQLLIDKGRCKESDFKIFGASVDTRVFQPKPPSKHILDEFNISPNVPVVGCVARLSWEKDHATILSAFAQLHQQYSDAILLLVGGGDEYDNLKQLATELGIRDTIRFANDREDVPDLLSVMSMNVLASICHETGAIALMEAMAMSIPVISSNIGVMPEYIRPDETGWLFEPKSVDGLVACMKDVLTDWQKKEHIRKQGRQEILMYYNKKDRMMAYCDFLAQFE